MKTNEIKQSIEDVNEVDKLADNVIDLKNEEVQTRNSFEELVRRMVSEAIIENDIDMNTILSDFELQQIRDELEMIKTLTEKISITNNKLRRALEI